MKTSFKPRILLVAVVHLALTIFVYYSFPGRGGIHWQLTSAFWENTFYLLQPQAWIWDRFFCWGGFHLTEGLLKSILWFFVYASMPLWSICFGWIFVKLDNWLNHFPVLGKRVF
jgi:hypothetical protein